MPIKDSSLDNTAGKKHPVPQNVMDVEFKVVGDMSLRQLFYLILGFSSAYIAWRLAIPDIWRWAFAILFSVLGVAIAFIPFQERGLDKWVVIFIKSMFAPTQMIWKKTYTPPSFFLSDYAEIIKNEIITLTPIKSRSKLEAYLENIQETDDPLDSLGTARLKLVKDKLTDFNVITEQYTQERESPTLVIPILSPTTNDQKVEKQEQSPVSEIPSLKKETVPNNPPKDIEATPEKESSTKNTIVIENQPEQIPDFEELRKDEIDSKNELLNALADIEGGYNQEGPIEVVNKSEYNRPINIGNTEKSQGEINIKGLRKLPPIIIAEDIKGIKIQEESLEKKVTELLDIAKKVRKKYNLDINNVEKTPVKNEPDQVKTIKDRFSELRTEKDKLTTELQRSDEQIKLLQKDSKNTTELQKQIEILSKRNKELEQLLSQIHGELYKAKKEQEMGFEVDQNFSKETKSIADKTKTQPASPPVNKNKINIIEGTIKSKAGELVENAVVLIKDKDGNVLRALKTNKLGQFSVQSPLQNGKYIVEAIKGGLEFDILAIEANGQILPPLYFVAR